MEEDSLNGSFRNDAFSFVPGLADPSQGRAKSINKKKKRTESKEVLGYSEVRPTEADNPFDHLNRQTAYMKDSNLNSNLEPHDKDIEAAHFPMGSPQDANYKINPSSMGAESGNGFGL
jgi:hypothetical protein